MGDCASIIKRKQTNKADDNSNCLTLNNKSNG